MVIPQADVKFIDRHISRKKSFKDLHLFTQTIHWKSLALKINNRAQIIKHRCFDFKLAFKVPYFI